MNNMYPRELDATVKDTYMVKIQTPKGEERKFRILITAKEEEYQTKEDDWIKDANGYLLVLI